MEIHFKGEVLKNSKDITLYRVEGPAFQTQNGNEIKESCIVLIVNGRFPKQYPLVYKNLWAMSEPLCTLLQKKGHGIFSSESWVMFLLTCNLDTVLGVAEFKVTHQTLTLNVFCTFPKALRQDIPGKKRKDLGRFMMEQLEKYSRDNGLTRIDLYSVTEAIPFYTKLGFKSDEDFPSYMVKHVSLVDTL